MTKSAIVASLVVALVTCSGAAMARLDAVSEKEASAALKTALDKGAEAAVPQAQLHERFLPVVRKLTAALDGVFLMLAEEERKIRKDPLR